MLTGFTTRTIYNTHDLQHARFTTCTIYNMHDLQHARFLLKPCRNFVVIGEPEAIVAWRGFINF